MTWRARRNVAHFCAEQGRGNSLTAAQDGRRPDHGLSLHGEVR